MTIDRNRSYRLFLRIFALANGAFSVGLLLIRKPAFSTPFFQYPLLAALHALALGSLLPLLFDRFYRPTSAFRLGGVFVLVGEMVMVTGFLIHPRSALPALGGLLVFFGIFLGGSGERVRTYRFLYWTALLLSALIGYVLGGVLIRPVIDPIPFSMIAVHALLGSILGLYPLFWIRSATRVRAWVLVPLTLAGILFVRVLERTLVDRSILALALLFLMIGALGATRAGRLGYGLFLLFSILALGTGWMLPGEWISLLGLFLLVACYLGYFRNGSAEVQAEGETA